MHIINIEVEAGKAMVEVALPECQDREQVKFWNIYLWDEKGLPAFQCSRLVEEEEPCVIQILHPKLWEGPKAPYLYRLELYSADSNSRMRLFESRHLALYSFKEISTKGCFLNGQEFAIKGVYYDCVDVISDAIRQGFEDGLKTVLNQLAKMGANMLILGTVDGVTGQEYTCLHECCEKKGIILRTGLKDDRYVIGDNLFCQNGLPTKDYYRYKAQWSKEAFVYIDRESFTKQPDGACMVTIYSNCRKVALLINGTVFAFKEDGPEFCFQDIPIKGFPMYLTAEADECSMSAVCYGVKRDS